jgi:hypothetical protein
MLLQSLQLHSSLVTNGGLRIKYEHPATKNLGIAAVASFCIHQEWNESQKSLFYLFSYFLGLFEYLCTHVIYFYAVQKSHFYVASHLMIVASHIYKMQLLSPFIVIVLSPFIFALSPVLPVDT